MSKRWCGILLGFRRLWEELNDENFQDLWISPQAGVIFGTANYSKAVATNNNVNYRQLDRELS